MLHYDSRRGVYSIVNRARKRALIAVAIPIALVILVFSFKAHFFILPFATIEENGQVVGGYVYGNSYRPKRVSHILVTRSENGQRHSYLASIHGPIVFDCEDWTAPHLPLFMFPDVNPPCVKVYLAEEIPLLPKTPERDIKATDRTFDFTANDGKRVTVKW